MFTWPAENPALLGSRCNQCGIVGFPAAEVIRRQLATPGISIAIEQLSAKLVHQGRPVEPGIIEAFLASHDLLKKTLDTKQ